MQEIYWQISLGIQFIIFFTSFEERFLVKNTHTNKIINHYLGYVGPPVQKAFFSATKLNKKSQTFFLPSELFLSLAYREVAQCKVLLGKHACKISAQSWQAITRGWGAAGEKSRRCRIAEQLASEARSCVTSFKCSVNTHYSIWRWRLLRLTASESVLQQHTPFSLLQLQKINSSHN